MGNRIAKALSSVIAVCSVALVIGCAGLGGSNVETNFWGARAAYVEAKRGYWEFALADNARIEQCYIDNQFTVDALMEAKSDAELEAACPPTLDATERAIALDITTSADAEFAALDAALEADSTTSINTAETLGRLATLTARLLLTYGGNY